MIVCGVDIKGKEAILAVVALNDDENVEHIACATKKLALYDHEDASSLIVLKRAIVAFAGENKIDSFVIKSRKASGQLAASGITFKIEALFQLSGTTVSFVSAPTLSAFAKKSNLATPPQSTHGYQADAYRAAAWKLAKV